MARETRFTGIATSWPPALEDILPNKLSSTRTHLSLGPTRNSRSRIAAPVHPSLNRNHSYPAPIAREYHYADNSAVGHNMYHSNRTVVPSAATYQDPQSDFYTTQGLSRSQTYLLPAAMYSAQTYDRELDLGDDHTDLASTTEPNRSYTLQRTPGGNHQMTWDRTNQDAPPNSDYGHYPSQQSSDEDEDPYYVEQASTNGRPHSPTTQRYLQEVSPHDRIRLGLRRYPTREEEQRSYEPATRYGTSSHQGRSRNRSTRHH
jgi:hypothetical protein